MASCKLLCTLLILVVALLTLSPVIEAGCYGKKNKHLKRLIPTDKKFYNHKPVKKLPLEKLPKYFDWGDINGTSLLQPSWNQHIPQYCGSCYLHATLSMVQDRISVMTQGKSRVMLGRQSFLNCGPLKNFSQGCNGGDVYDVLGYMKEFGLPDETCLTYKATDFSVLSPAPLGKSMEDHHCPARGICRNCMPMDDGSDNTHCWTVKQPIMYKVTAYGLIGNSTLDMMNEIYQRGPITCSIAVDDKFAYEYDNSIWTDTKPDDVDHDVEVVGWGEENGVKYWNIRNSWGSYWGKLGFFRLERGKNVLQLEMGDCWYAEPSIEMEREVEDGVYIGSMDGLKKRVKPSMAKIDVASIKRSQVSRKAAI